MADHHRLTTIRASNGTRSFDVQIRVRVDGVPDTTCAAHALMLLDHLSLAADQYMRSLGDVLHERTIPGPAL